VPRDEKITLPLIDHPGRARVMLEALASEWGVEHQEIRSRHHEYVVGHFAEVEAAGRKHERMLVQHHSERAAAKADEAMALVQPLLGKMARLEVALTERESRIAGLEAALAEIMRLRGEG
jgi:hypothetical protein